MLKADERIEKLLNRFGQTISDLPKVDHKKPAYAYKPLTRTNAAYAALEWGYEDQFSSNYMMDYICHLADVIDRMEVALETATNTMDCRRCEASLQDCNFNCNKHSKVADWQLSGMYPYEFKEFVENAGDK